VCVCVCCVVRARAGVAHVNLNTDRCTGATSVQRGNCGLAGPPGALRHHKAYGTGVVPVLNPASNTQPFSSFSVLLWLASSALSSASRVSPCPVYASRSEGHRPKPTVPGNHYEQPRSGVTVRSYLIISIYGKNLPDVRLLLQLSRPLPESVRFGIYDLGYFIRRYKGHNKVILNTYTCLRIITNKLVFSLKL